MSKTRILPTRTHRLGGARVEAGVAVDVPAADADLALRHGWAVLAGDGKAKPKGKAKTASGGNAVEPEPEPEADTEPDTAADA